MQCDEFEDRLNAVLDERRRPEWDTELSLHCENCAGCRQLAAAYDRLLDGFYALAAPDAQWIGLRPGLAVDHPHVTGHVALQRQAKGLQRTVGERGRRRRAQLRVR